MPTQPSTQVCPICAYDDDLSWEVEGPGLWRFTCASAADGHPYSWLTTGKSQLNTSGHEGMANELGIYEDLLAVFNPAEPLLEYGVIEYRYGIGNPAAYQLLIDTYSHTKVGPTQYSASAFIGGALGRLHRDGLLVARAGRSTGYWKYNGTLKAYGRPPLTDERPILTWTEFAEQSGLDPTDWPLVP